MGIKVTKTEIDGVLIIEPDYFFDERGYYAETFSERSLIGSGIKVEKHFVQDSHSYNVRARTFRGFHFQNKPHNQTKIVRCVRGKMIDIAIDLRKNSKTYLKAVCVELSAENHKQLYIPNYCAHGYLTLEDNVEMVYKLDEFWYPTSESSINIDDITLPIKLPFPKDTLIYNKKDKMAPHIKDAKIDVE